MLIQITNRIINTYLILNISSWFVHGNYCQLVEVPLLLLIKFIHSSSLGDPAGEANRADW